MAAKIFSKTSRQIIMILTMLIMGIGALKYPHAPIKMIGGKYVDKIRNVYSESEYKLFRVLEIGFISIFALRWRYL